MLKLRKKLSEKKEASKGIAKAGFTLIELIVVIAILGILVLLAAPRFLGYTKDANVSTMQADAKVLANAALVYNVESGTRDQNEPSWPIDGGEFTQELGGVEVTYATFNDEALDDHVQTLKNDIDNYALVTEPSGDLKEGDVVYIGNDFEGVEGRDERVHFGLDHVLDAPAE